MTREREWARAGSAGMARGTEPSRAAARNRRAPLTESPAMTLRPDCSPARMLAWHGAVRTHARAAGATARSRDPGEQTSM